MSSKPTALLQLNDERALGPAIAGAKAAMLARAKQAGLPVLDGFVVPVAASRDAVAIGHRALHQHNSGFARARITGAAFDPELVLAASAAARALGSRLVVRSSAVVEGEGAWAGAFASYAELTPDEVIQGIVGCWSSVFSPDALGRAQAQGIAADELGMAVLIQRELTPDYGGVATVAESGTVTIVGTEGTPASIVSGWERGHVVVVDVDGAAPGRAVAALGADRVAAVAELARTTGSLTGYNHIEWAEAEGRLWLLQAQPGVASRAGHTEHASAPEVVIEPAGLADPVDLLARIAIQADERDPTGRLGKTRWEPELFQAVSALGSRHSGRGAAGGWGAGRIRLIRDASDAELFRPREVVAAVYPLNNLAPLLWDAAALISTGGSPGAHLFEVASWLGVPAVCGVDLEEVTGLTLDQLKMTTQVVGAVNGDDGVVSLLDVGRPA